jgi:hypothetical protein
VAAVGAGLTALLPAGAGRPVRVITAEVSVEAAVAVPAELDPVTTVTTALPATTLPPTTAAPPVSATATPESVVVPAHGHVNQFDMAPYHGLGTWIDVYDWSATYTGGQPRVDPSQMAEMAADGVQTLFIQAGKWDAPTDVLEPDRLVQFIHDAHANGIRVVAWYLPTLVDPTVDLQRMLAVASLDVDGFAVDMEARDVADPADRSARAVALSAALRTALPGRVIGMIPLPPVVMDVVNPNYWPDYPWTGMAPYYDVWLPMNYWTFRKADSGYRSGYTYTAENIDRMRAHVGDPTLVCHALGGLAEATSPEDAAGMIQAATERGCIGGSVYDFRTTNADTWTALQPLRAG